MFAHRSIGRSSLRSTPPLQQPQCTRLQGYTENGLDFIGTWEEGKKRYIQYNGHNNDIEKKRFSSFLLFWTARNCRIFFSKRAFAIDFAVAATNTAFYILPCCRFIPRSKEEESGTRATQAQKRSCIPFFPPRSLCCGLEFQSQRKGLACLLTSSKKRLKALLSCWVKNEIRV